jgi:CHAT domain-containing protein
MATLWSVADESTQLLMSEFYRLHKENPSITKAGAMQRAQVEMIEGKLKSSGKSAGCRSETVRLDGLVQEKFKCDANAPFAHPFYWSPFVLIGNWR